MDEKGEMCQADDKVGVVEVCRLGEVDGNCESK